jgi:peptide chain release factor 1
LDIKTGKGKKGLKKMIFSGKLDKLKEEFDKLNHELSDTSIISNRELYSKKMKQYSEMRPVIDKYDEYLRVQTDMRDSEEILKNEADAEMQEMAKQEMENSAVHLAKLEKELEILLIPKDPNDVKNAILEIRAGTGGDEAGLFAADLYKMYTRWAEIHHYKVDVMNSSPTELGGFKEIVFMIIGPNAYGKLKFESGGHRVQRVPDTETQGRIHTSAATVAVLPEQEEFDFEIKPEDLKIEVCRASGAGGQHVNRTESAVRIVHLPTGLEVQCQDERSQMKNREKAMKVLRARVKDRLEGEEKAKLDSTRLAQIGSGDRSEKVRTYNFPQNRITDHRIGFTVYNLDHVIQGEIDEFIEKLGEENNARLLQQK